jgi:hypothetical protein
VLTAASLPGFATSLFSRQTVLLQVWPAAQEVSLVGLHEVRQVLSTVRQTSPVEQV